MTAIQKSGEYKELCIVCEEEKELGIHLNTSFLCVECEKTMLSVEPSEPLYRYFIQKLRKIKSVQISS